MDRTAKAVFLYIGTVDLFCGNFGCGNFKFDAHDCFVTGYNMTTEQRPSLPDVMADAVDHLSKFSIPLYVEDRFGRPEQYGTGFFVSVGATHFLVSAAHVLDVRRGRDVFFYDTPTTLRHLTGRALTTGGSSATYDDRDVAVMKLTGDAMPPFPEVDKFAMDVSYLKPNYLPRSRKHYVIVGFPATKSRVDSKDRNVLASAYGYRSDSIDDGSYRDYGVDPTTHLVLPFDLRRGVDVRGNRVTFPKPQGMSGSPVVALYDLDETVEDRFRVFPVVGVGIEHRRRSKALVATDVRFVLEMISLLLR